MRKHNPSEETLWMKMKTLKGNKTQRALKKWGRKGLKKFNLYLEEFGR